MSRFAIAFSGTRHDTLEEKTTQSSIKKKTLSVRVAKLRAAYRIFASERAAVTVHNAFVLHVTILVSASASACHLRLSKEDVVLLSSVEFEPRCFPF